MSSMGDAMRKAGIQSKQPERRGRGGQGGGGKSRSHGGRQRQDLPEFPDSYFTTDDRGNPCRQTDFVSKKVDELVRILASDCHPQLTTGQARRFFNHCRDIERRLKVDGESWQQIAADFESLSFHAQYASSGQNRKISQEFHKDFIDRNVKRVMSSDDPCRAFLDGFLPHFEALVGFGAAYMRD